MRNGYDLCSPERAPVPSRGLDNYAGARRALYRRRVPYTSALHERVRYASERTTPE